MMPSTLPAFSTLLLLLSTLSTPTLSDRILIPFPTGRNVYNTSLTHFTLTDHTRSDPYAAKNVSRALRLSLFYPLSSGQCPDICKEKYMPYWTAYELDDKFFPGDDYRSRSRSANSTSRGEEDDGVLFSAKLQVCCDDSDSGDKSRKERDDAPKNVSLVLLSPEVGTSRLLYGALAQQIASNGYAVVTIDHPYDAAVVEYQNDAQTSVYGNIHLDPFGPITQFNDTVRKAVETRTADLVFLINSLNSTFLGEILPDISQNSSLSTNKVGIVGHGIGGTAAAALVAQNEPRVAVAVDLDGTPLPLPAQGTIHTPFLFFGRQNHTRDQDLTLSTQWPQLNTSASYEWDMRNSSHFDYSDVGLLAELAEVEKGGVKGVGSVGGMLAWNISSQFTTAYLDVFVKGRKKSILKGLVDQYGKTMVPYGGMEAFLRMLEE